MNISIIASIGKNNELGIDGKLLWHLPDDLKNFKRITSGHIIVMGKKTYESIGRPLPDRKNIILTRDINYEAEGCIIAHSPEEILKFVNDKDEIFIIGGGEIYKLFLPLANQLYLTEVDGEKEADTYFPSFNKNDWRLINSVRHDIDEKHNYSFRMNVYEKIR